LLPGAAQKPCGVNFLEFWWKKKPTKTLDSSFFFHQNSKIPAFGGKFGGIKKKSTWSEKIRTFWRLSGRPNSQLASTGTS
jgi:hypothetical protein